MADELEKAIIQAYDPMVSPQDRSSALEYLAHISEAVGGWRTFVEKLFGTSDIQVALTCLTAIGDIVLHRYEHLIIIVNMVRSLNGNVVEWHSTQGKERKKNADGFLLFRTLFGSNFSYCLVFSSYLALTTDEHVELKQALFTFMQTIIGPQTPGMSRSIHGRLAESAFRTHSSPICLHYHAFVSRHCILHTI
jgi:hypothetical protein